MSVRRQRRRDRKTGAMVEFLIVDVEVMRPDGRTERKRKVAPVQTRRGAEQYERELRQAMLDEKLGKWKEVPKFKEWFENRYWNEWVVGRKNKPSTVENKLSVFEHHLESFFGQMRLDEIKLAEIARFRAELIRKGLKSCRSIGFKVRRRSKFISNFDLGDVRRVD